MAEHLQAQAKLGKIGIHTRMVARRMVALLKEFVASLVC